MAAKKGGHWPRGANKVEKGEQIIKKRRQKLIEQGAELFKDDAKKRRVLIVKYMSPTGEYEFGKVLSRRRAGLSDLQILGQIRIENQAPDAEVIVDRWFATFEDAAQWYKGMEEIPEGEKPRFGVGSAGIVS
jgi:hypothetical protein